MKNKDIRTIRIENNDTKVARHMINFNSKGNITYIKYLNMEIKIFYSGNTVKSIVGYINNNECYNFKITYDKYTIVFDSQFRSKYYPIVNDNYKLKIVDNNDDLEIVKLACEDFDLTKIVRNRVMVRIKFDNIIRGYSINTCCNNTIFTYNCKDYNDPCKCGVSRIYDKHGRLIFHSILGSNKTTIKRYGNMVTYLMDDKVVRRETSSKTRSIYDNNISVKVEDIEFDEEYKLFQYDEFNRLVYIKQPYGKQIVSCIYNKDQDELPLYVNINGVTYNIIITYRKVKS